MKILESVMFYFVLLVSLIFVITAAIEPYNNCGCKYSDNGKHYVISMKDVKPKNKYFTLDGTSIVWTYYFNPCDVFSKDKCTDVIMCQEGGKESFPIAKKEIKNCDEYKNNKTTLYYQKVKGPIETRQMKLTLDCNKEVTKPKFSPVTESQSLDTSIFELTITAKAVCPKEISSKSTTSHNLSAGSVLVIIFITLIVVYFVAGILFMKYKRGATGKEVIRNIEF
ncbi:uncharacterized protein LOC124439983 [Xenia sp. Carnegie-2017]|uniref:uncharacterized protein LOC124439983 n=1 Tax=Xenia sp. Carnegie-2017 TaxID=2897299 RepID=UPI001F03E7C9|nr:uncharacterized protein LOC124439983 [Xenia sp. Carnegie-2017]